MANLFVLPPRGDASEESAGTSPEPFLSPRRAWSVLTLVWLAVYLAALFSPSLLDDADATHANAAQHMALSGDWVTLKVDGIRYLEKPPLPYWMVAVCYRLFGFNVFATHLPMALGVLAVAGLAWVWARRAYDERAGFYAALGVLTSVGLFLFTRIYIPEVLLTFFLGLALFCFLSGLEDGKPSRFYVAWGSLALATLAKGLIAPVFFGAAAISYLLLTGEWRRWRELRIASGVLLFLLIAAPWHILAGLRNPDHGHPVGNIPSAGNVHGFFYFYFVNEHVLRFLGRRFPHDYNKQPWFVFWVGQLIWLFPWSLFLPLLLRRVYRSRHSWLRELSGKFGQAAVSPAWDSHAAFRRKSTWLLALFAGFVLIFFAVSTNQEYYTFPAYLPLLVLIAGELRDAEDCALANADTAEAGAGFLLLGAHGLFALVGICSALALAYGLWSSRHLPFVPDIGTLLAHRGVGGYSLSMSHFFDLTGPSFAALRLPATLAALTLALGPAAAWHLRRRGDHVVATTSIAFTAALFLVAAHIALVRFAPMLSSRAMADTINALAGDAGQDPAAGSRATLIIYGDQADASSLVFYTHRQALLVNGRSSSMLWGSYYPDAPRIFLNDAELRTVWGTGERKFLFAEGEKRERVESLLKARMVPVQELADKTLYTDRPLGNPESTASRP